MTRSDDLPAIDAIHEALDDDEPTWLTLPGVDIEPSPRLREALDGFDAGPTPAGAAATRWLRDAALIEHPISRTRLYIANGAIAGYYSLCNAGVEISQRDRRRALALDTPIGTLPGSLVTWLAKDYEAGIDGTLLIKHAAATAREAAAMTASVALVLDPFDDATAEVWKKAYGFRRSSGKSRRRWIPLAVAG